MPNPPAGTPTIGGSVSCPLCHKTVDPYKLNGAHVCAGTPNAVAEALETIRRRTKSWTVYDSSDEDFSERLDSDEGYRRLIAAARTQAFAEVRSWARRMPPDTMYDAATLLAALDALERGP